MVSFGMIFSKFSIEYSENFNLSFSVAFRPVTVGGRVCTCLDIKSVNFCCFLKTSILQLGMVEHLKMRQNCHRIEKYYFRSIPKI